MSSPISGVEIEALLPAGVCVEVATEADGASSLLAAEADLVRRASDVRRTEFGKGRACARRALSRLGVADTPILSLDSRAPAWPVGVSGSITHTPRFCAAAVARSSEVASIGIDGETAGAVTPDLWESVFQPVERAALRRLDPASGRLAATVFFSAKESAFKAQHPLTGRFVEFDEAVVRLTGASTLLVEGPFGVLDGVCLVRDGLVVTACWARREG
jgi:4'-phosphopantetheinyl transferase EntD